MVKAPKSGLSPMLRQYGEIKSAHPDAILLFRLGDFYEMFYEDAEIASNILGITLTTRNRNDPNPVPLCGVPHHSIEPYIAKLLTSGRRVAICDQVEDPSQAKGVVKREVTRVITPGVVADGLGLDAGNHNFLISLAEIDGKLGLSLTDISTGLFQSCEFDSREMLIEELLRSEPREILIPVEIMSDDILMAQLKGQMPSVLITEYTPSELDMSLLSGIEGAPEVISARPAAAQAAAGALSYLNSTQKGRIGHIRSLKPLADGAVMRLDEATKRNLEIVRTMPAGEREGSLLHTIDRTQTAAGARKLKRWLLYPLTDYGMISSRQGAVARIAEHSSLRQGLSAAMARIYDMERITGRISAGAANARDLIALMGSLEAAASIRTLISDEDGLLGEIGGGIDNFDALVASISERIADDPPISIRDGGIIKKGYSADLDELRSMTSHGKEFIAQLEQKERKSTSISSLKVRYNKVFGYYLEVTNAHQDKVPEHYIRKQTLVNAERFITPELKELEEKVLGAQDKSRALEQELLLDLRREAADYSIKFLATADALARLDVLTSFAYTAIENDYVRPEVDDGYMIDIRDGRHPIVERQSLSERFIANDVTFDDDTALMMITGPNMAGKSTVMRQTALIVLMAQTGSFVPASSARIGIADRIFTRVGASDALSKGQSTFMVEMAEASVILRDATERSLIIIDEIGRGTSTFDGLSIAWAVAEDLHDRVRARTMFATHYHELTELALSKPRIRNMNIAVKEWNDEIIFLRRLVHGATSRSYGIQVAKLAGLPEALLGRAGEVLENLEAGEFDDAGKPRLAEHHEGNSPKRSAADSAQIQLFCNPISDEIANRLRETNTESITPLEAMNILHELKGKLP
jgi:DNA mismatch repair protein MutS